MKRTDRYILRQFAQTFIFGLLAFIIIFIVVDLIENLDEFSDKNVGFGTIGLYYLYYVPEMIKLVAPIGMLLASLFTFTRLDTTHELTAIRTSGVSIARILLPLLAFGLLVSGGLIYFNGWIVPKANVARFEIDRQQMGRNIVGGASNTFLRLSPTLNLQMDYFDAASNTAQTVSLERTDSTALLLAPRIDTIDGRPRVGEDDSIRTLAIVERIDAAQMTWDSTSEAWTMRNGIARNLRDPERILATPFVERPVDGLGVTPAELMASQQQLEEMTLPEIKERIVRESTGGRDTRSLEIDYFAAFSFPFAAFIVILFGLPFSGRRRKGGAAIPIALTAVISALYLIFTEVSKTLSFTGDVPAIVTAWVANAVFLVVGLLNLWRVER